MKKVEYILIYMYRGTYAEIYDNIGLLRIALANLKEIYKNDNDFEYKIYCGKDVTDEIFDYNVKKIHLWERFLLLFIKPSYAYDDENVFVSNKCKKMFGKVYVLKENVSIKRGEQIER